MAKTGCTELIDYLIRPAVKPIFRGFFVILGVLFPIACFSQDTVGQMFAEPVFQSQVYVEEHGRQNDATVVLVHGTGEMGAKIWDSTIEYLKDAFHIITFDLPGFGRSEKKNELYSPENYTRFLKWIINKKGKEPVYLVGHSMGGAISLYFSGTYPELLKRLILVDAAGILHRASFTKNMIDRLIPGGIVVDDKEVIKKPLSDLRYLVKTTIENVDRSLMPDDLSALLRSSAFRATALKGDPIRISGMALIQTDFSPILANAEVPTAIIWGEEDTIAPVRTAKMLAGMIDRSSLTLLNNKGHNPMLDDPESFNSILLQSIIEPAISQYPKITTRTNLPEDLRDRVINGEEDLDIQGDFGRIVIKDSHNITIVNSTAKTIEIEDSDVSITNSRFGQGKNPVYIKDSVVLFTAVHITGETNITVYNSNIDLAGCRLKAEQSLIASEFASNVVFSVTRVESPERDGWVHTVTSLNLGDSF